MRLIVVVSTACILSSTVLASAQEWTDFVSKEDGFRVNFPGTPRVSESSYASEYGADLPARADFELGDDWCRVEQDPAGRDFRLRGVDAHRGGAVVRLVGSVGVVDIDELLEQRLQVFQVACGTFAQPALQGLVGAFGLAAGLRVVTARADR